MSAKKTSLEDAVKAYLDALDPETPPVSEAERIKRLQALADLVGH